MTENNNAFSLINSLKSLWNHFTVKRKYQLVLITLATFITAILDLVSIGTIMPFISVIMDSEATFNNPSFNEYFINYGYSSGEEIILPITYFFILINIIAAIIKVIIFWFLQLLDAWYNFLYLSYSCTIIPGFITSLIG